MAITVGGVAIDLSASSVQVVREMDAAARAVQRASGNMGGSLSRWSTSFNSVERQVTAGARRIRGAFAALSRLALPALGLGGGLGIAGLASLTKQALATADQIAKASDRAGLATDAFQALSFQASQTGVSQETLNNSLLVFGQRVGAARVGTGELATMMERLNPQLAAALRNSTSQAQALRLVADAIKGARDQTEALAIAQAAFGRGGRELVLTLRGGAEAVDDFARRAKELGLIIPEEGLRGAEKARDQLDVLSRVISAQLTGAIVKAAPQITELGKRFTDAIPAVVEFVTTALEQLARFDRALQHFHQQVKGQLTPESLGISDALAVELRRMGVTIGHMADVVRDLDEIWDQLEGRSSSAADAIEQVSSSIADIPDVDFDTSEVSAGASETERALSSIESAIRGIRNEAFIAQAETEEYARVLTILAGAGVDIDPAGLQRFGEESDATRQKVNELIATIQSMREVPVPQFKPLEVTGGISVPDAPIPQLKPFNPDELQEQVEFINLLTDDVAQLQHQFTSMSATLAQAFDAGLISAEQYASMLDNVAQRFDPMTRAVQAFSIGLSAGLADIAFGRSTFEDFAKSIVRNLISMAIQAAVTTAIMTALHSLFDPTAGARASSTAASVMGFLAGMVGGGTTGFARGGVIDRRQDFVFGGGKKGMAGEAGQEAILPLTRAPGGDLGVKAVGGGGDTNFTFAPVVDARGAGPGVAGDISRVLEAERKRLKSEIIGDFRRNPGMRSAAGIR